MKTSFDTPLRLEGNGMAVHVSGSLVWEHESGGCTVDVTIVQTFTGTPVTASGRSPTYKRDTPTWSLTADTAGDQRLVRGPAHGNAVLTFRDVPEPPVTWTQALELT